MMEKTQAKPLTAAQQRQRDKKRRTWLRTGEYEKISVNKILL